MSEWIAHSSCVVFFLQLFPHFVMNTLFFSPKTGVMTQQNICFNVETTRWIFPQRHILDFIYKKCIFGINFIGEGKLQNNSEKFQPHILYASEMTILWYQSKLCFSLCLSWNIFFCNFHSCRMENKLQLIRKRIFKAHRTNRT